MPEMEQWGRNAVRRPAAVEFPTAPASSALPGAAEKGELEFEQLPIPFDGTATWRRTEIPPGAAVK
jgi:hypothetical protein